MQKTEVTRLRNWGRREPGARIHLTAYHSASRISRPRRLDRGWVKIYNRTRRAGRKKATEGVIFGVIRGTLGMESVIFFLRRGLGFIVWAIESVFV